MNRQNKSLMTMVYTALLTAVVFLCTLLIRVPVGADCYIHLGDAIIFISVIMLPRKHACFAGTVGAVLSDLATVAVWAPWTFACKLLMILVFGFFIDRAKKSLDTCKRIGSVPLLELIGYVLAALVMTVSYFFAELLLFGNWIEAAACMGFNMIQVAIGAIISVIVTDSIKKTSMKDIMYYIR